MMSGPPLSAETNGLVRDNQPYLVYERPAMRREASIRVFVGAFVYECCLTAAGASLSAASNSAARA